MGKINATAVAKIEEICETKTNHHYKKLQYFIAIFTI